MAEKKARAPMELPNMPAQFEKDYMQATSESGPTGALLDKYDAAGPRDLPGKILKAAKKAMKEKEATKKAYGGMTSTRKKVMKKQMGGAVSKVVPPTQINAGASVPPSQKSTMGMKYGGMAKKKTKMAKGGSTFKTCASCPSPSKCKAAGGCLKNKK